MKQVTLGGLNYRRLEKPRKIKFIVAMHIPGGMTPQELRDHIEAEIKASIGSLYRESVKVFRTADARDTTGGINRPLGGHSREE